MYQKYGPGWDLPLFHSANTHKVEPEPFQAQLLIDDATENKAEVFQNYSATNDLVVMRYRVLQAFQNLKEATDNDVARYLNKIYHSNIHPSTVSARRNELRDRGLLVPLLDDEGKKKKKVDYITKKSNILWKVIR